MSAASVGKEGREAPLVEGLVLGWRGGGVQKHGHRHTVKLVLAV